MDESLWTNLTLDKSCPAIIVIYRFIPSCLWKEGREQSNPKLLTLGSVEQDHDQKDNQFPFVNWKKITLAIQLFYQPKNTTTVHLSMKYLVDNYLVFCFFNFWSYGTKFWSYGFYLFRSPVLVLCPWFTESGCTNHWAITLQSHYLGALYWVRIDQNQRL